MPRVLTLEAARENAMMLASLVPGMTIDEAERRFSRTVLVVAESNNDEARALAADIRLLLERTFTSVVSDATDPHDLCVSIGNCWVPHAKEVVYVSGGSDRVRIAREPEATPRLSPLHGLARLVVACYVAASVTAELVPEMRRYRRANLTIELAALGFTLRELSSPVMLTGTCLAGVGAVGCGFLMAISRLPVHGRLAAADFDLVSSGNLQRQICFGPEDVGHPKVARAIAWMQDQTKSLEIFDAGGRIEQVAITHGLDRVLVALDSPRIRRTLQELLPLEVFDASTTGIQEVISFHTRLDAESACLGCVYPRNDQELAWTAHVANHLGVAESEVEQDSVSANSAQLIAARHNIADPSALIGQRYDTLFKALCGSSPVRTDSGDRAVAPFAFVSVLAGALLAFRLHQSLAGQSGDWNYWNVSPWHPPRVTTRRVWQKDPECETCGRSPYIRARSARLREAESANRALNAGGPTASLARTVNID